MYRLCLLLIACCCITCAHSQTVFPFCHNNLYGLVSSDGKIILQPKYERISLSSKPWSDNSMMVHHNKMSGLISNTGEELIPPVHENLRYDGNGGFAWYYDNNSNERGLHVYSIRNKKWIYTSDSLRLIEVLGEGTVFGKIKNSKNGANGILAEDGTMIIQPVRDNIEIDFPEEECPLLRIGSIQRAVFIDCHGDTTTFDDYMIEHEIDFGGIGLSMIEGSDDGIEVLDAYPRPQIPADIRVKEEVKEDGRLVSFIGIRESKYGLLSPDGEILIPFEHIQLFQNQGYIESITDGYRGLFSNTGQVILKPLFQMIEYNKHESSYFKVYTTNGYCGYANSYGHVYLPEGVLTK